MTYLPIILIVLISLVILIVAVVIFTAIVGDYKTGLSIRDAIAQRVKYLRLDKMLAKRNIKREDYLHTESITNIENQIRNCESCSEIKQCDEALKQGSPADLSFCPNDEVFESIANKSNSITKSHTAKNSRKKN
jgi:hypothetical protein